MHRTAVLGAATSTAGAPAFGYRAAIATYPDETTLELPEPVAGKPAP